MTPTLPIKEISFLFPAGNLSKQSAGFCPRLESEPELEVSFYQEGVFAVRISKSGCLLANTYSMPGDQVKQSAFPLCHKHTHTRQGYLLFTCCRTVISPLKLQQVFGWGVAGVVFDCNRTHLSHSLVPFLSPSPRQTQCSSLSLSPGSQGEASRLANGSRV